MNTMIEMYDRIMSVVEEVTGISKDKKPLIVRNVWMPDTF